MDSEPEIPFEALQPYIEPRPSREPQRMGDILKAEAWLVGEEDPTKAIHPYDGLCRFCGCELETKWTQLGPLTTGWFPVNTCDPCYAKYKKAPADLKASDEAWAKVCPAEFRAPWDNSKADRTLLDRVMRFNLATRKGLVIHGKSGKAKTRAAWALARRLFNEGIGFVFIPTTDLTEEPYKNLCATGVLFLDDLGNEPLGTAREMLLLRVLRARADWHRPTIITSQFVGEGLKARFAEKNTAEAIVRRIRENCEDVSA